MHDRVIESTGGAPDAPGPSCPACGPSGAPAEAAAPLLRVPLPSVEDLATVAEARAAIDGLDAALAVLLERRAAVAALVQRLKPVGGFAGRDPDRERAIVDAMAEHAPSLGRDSLAKIMSAVIEAGLAASGH